MPAHPLNIGCRKLQAMFGVVAKYRQGTTLRRLATSGGEKCGLEEYKFLHYCRAGDSQCLNLAV